MAKRKALNPVEPNTLSSRGLPRLGGSNRSLRRRKFASTSKTPKISNRAGEAFLLVASSDGEAGTPSTTMMEGPAAAVAGESGIAEHGFVTTRTRNHHRRPPANVAAIPFPSLGRSEATTAAALVKARESDSKAKTPHNNDDLKTTTNTAARWTPSFLVEKPPQESSSLSSDEDMDVRSDNDELMNDESSPSSPEGSPPPNLAQQHFRPTPLDLKHPNGQFRGPSISPKMDHGSDRKPAGSSSLPSAEAVSPIRHGRATNRPMQDPTHGDPELEDEYLLQRVRDTPADDPSVLAKVLSSTRSSRNGGDSIAPLIGKEIGVQEPSLDGSEITSSTTLVTESMKNSSRALPLPPLMPSFSPREAVANCGLKLSSDDLLPPVQPSNDEPPFGKEFVEEWSLPDEETNGLIFFELDGKSYVHDPLPPGWELKISKSHTAPYYVHPDRHHTWYCPIPLKPKSEALVFRRSSFGKELASHKAHHLADNVKIRPKDEDAAASAEPRQTSFDASMSDVIKDCNNILMMQKNHDDGYAASISSRSSMESSAVIAGVNEGSESADHNDSTCPEEVNDWSTPLRSGIKTPKGGREVPAKKASTPALSPIAEDERAYLLGDEEGPEDDYVLSEVKLSSSTKNSQQRLTSDIKKSGKSNIETASSYRGTDERRQSEGKRSTPRVSFEPREISRKGSISSPGTPDRKQATVTPGVAKHGSRPGHSSAKRRQTPPSARSPTPRKKHAPEASTPVSESDDPDATTNSASAKRSNTIEIASVRHSSQNRVANRRLERCTPLYTPPVEARAKGAPSRRDAPMKRKSLPLTSSLRHRGAPFHDNFPIEEAATNGEKSLAHADGETPTMGSSSHHDISAKSQSSSFSPLCVNVPWYNDCPTNGRLDEGLKSLSQSDEETILEELPNLQSSHASLDESKSSQYSPKRANTPEMPSNNEVDSAVESDLDIGIGSSGKNAEKWSSLHEPEPAFIEKHRDGPGPADTPSAESFGFDPSNDYSSDDHSFPAEDKASTPGPSINDRHGRGRVRMPSSHSQNSQIHTKVQRRPRRPSKQFDVPSPISFGLDDNSAESVQAQPVDDHGSESLFSPRLSKGRRTRTFSWRVLHPFHPLCALQRLDDLLEAQKKRMRKENRHQRTKASNRAVVQKVRRPSKRKAQAKKKRRS